MPEQFQLLPELVIRAYTRLGRQSANGCPLTDLEVMNTTQRGRGNLARGSSSVN